MNFRKLIVRNVKKYKQIEYTDKNINRLERIKLSHIDQSKIRNFFVL